MSGKTKTSAAKEEATSTRVPKLRFPEFRGAEGWASEPMGEVYSFKGNNSLSRDKLNYVTGSVKNIHYGDIHTKFSTHFDITKELVPFINQSEESVVRDENLCAEGDMIFADASEDMADIGKSIEIVRLNRERVASGLHTILARRIGERIALGFGGHLFKSGWVRTQIQKEAQGAKVLGISPTRLRNLRLPLPHDKAEQQKIAECLSSVDELMAAQARKVDALKTHKKGLMQQLFPTKGETQPRLRFLEFQNAGEWMSESLGNIFETASGGTPSRAEKEYWNGDIPWITTSLVDFRVITGAEEFLTAEGLKNSSAKLFPKGTVLMAMYGQGKTRGQVALLDIKAATNQACAAILPRKDIDPYFVFLNLAGRCEEIREMSNSGGQENLSQGLIREIRFAFPPDDDEQRKVTACLSSLDALITLETQKLEALKTHKKGLMQQLFPSPEAVEA
jgi:type I restriction enzyme S subunit